MAKLMDLMEHFELHQTEARAVGEQLSFSTFLYLHFIADDEHEHEQDTEDSHEDLPFQKISSNTFFVLKSILFATRKIIIPEQVFGITPVFYSFEFPFAVFHPPCEFLA